MQSIPIAMTREMLGRCWQNLIIFICAANFLPTFIFVLFRSKGLETDSPEMRVFLARFTLMNIFICGATFFDLANLRPNQFSLPISTQKLAAYLIIPSMIIVALEVVLVIAIENAVFSQQMPLWGPALFASISSTAIWATILSSKGSYWRYIAVPVVAAVLVTWFVIRFETAFYSPRALPSIDFFCLSIIGIASYVLAVQAVASNRRGDTIGGFPIPMAIHQLFLFDFESTTPFRNGKSAQFWTEWYHKGWLMPALAFVGIAISLALWPFLSGNPTTLVKGFFEGGIMLAAVGGIVGGFTVGINNLETGQTNNRLGNEIGQFLATRPLTSREIAYSSLKVLGIGSLMTWAVWTIIFLFVCLLLACTGTAPLFLIPSTVKWWYVPFAAMGMWICGSIFGSLLLTGNKEFMLTCVLVTVGGATTELFLTEWLLSYEAKLKFNQAVSNITGLALIVGTVIVFAAAQKRGLIEAKIGVYSLLVWILLIAAILFEWSRISPHSFTVTFFAGLAALSVSPFALTPMAVAWNRNR